MKNKRVKIKIDYQKLKMSISNFISKKGILIKLEIDNLKEIINEFCVNGTETICKKDLLKIISKLNETNIKELRIHIKCKKENIPHSLGISKAYVNWNNLINIKHNEILEKIQNDPETFFNDYIFHKNKDKNIKTIAEKINTFISYYENIANINQSEILLFYLVKYKMYTGCFVFHNGKNCLVINANKWIWSNNHVFCNCHIKSLRHQKAKNINIDRKVNYSNIHASEVD